MEHAVCRGQDSYLPAAVDERRRQVTYDVAAATDLTAGERAVFCREKYYVPIADVGGPALPREMQCLPEHVGRNQCESTLGHAEAAFAIYIVIFADYHAVRDFRAAIDNGATDAAVASDSYVRQNNTVVDAAV